MAVSLRNFLTLILGAVRDLAPIILVIAFFQIVVLQQPLPNLTGVLTGLVLVLLGLASSIPGRSPLIDGFGLIALASLFPMITVMGYAQIGVFLAKRSRVAPRAPSSIGRSDSDHSHPSHSSPTTGPRSHQ